MAQQNGFSLKGTLLGARNCDWGCPCSFESPPTYGKCEGGYTWHVDSGSYQGTDLSGSNFSFFGHFPGAPHEGNGTALWVIDDSTPQERRPVIEAMIQEASPMSIFFSLTPNFLGFTYASYDLHLDGIRSRMSINGIAELQLTPMKNPVTGEDELATLTKPTGFTSKIQELCATETLKITAEGLAYDHSGKYAEFSPYEYPI
jgi:hypothetical protein